MNDRIRELAQQAGCAWWEGRALRDMTQCQPDLEKFAELIVRECAEVSFKHWEQHKGCSAHFSIREHFGVKDE